MEKDSRKKNERIMNNFTKNRNKIEDRVKYAIKAYENKIGRPATREEKAKIRHKVTHDFRTRLAVRIGAVSLVGLTAFSAGKMLNEGSGKIEGVTQENPDSVTVEANNFREGIKVVGLGDEGILVVQDENGQDVPVTSQNIEDIKAQNDLIAQREAQRQQIRDDVKNIHSEKDALEYMKKLFREQYKINNGREIAGNIQIYLKNTDLNRSTIEEIIVKKANGELIESWNEKNNEDNSVGQIGGLLVEVEQLRRYYRDNSPDSYLSRKGGEKDQLADFLIKAKGLDEEQIQKSDGMEPGE